MPRYIDADELLEIIDYYIVNDKDARKHHSALFVEGMKDGYFRIRSKVTDMPTADVREVVRCKDCKYMCHYTDGHLECRLLSDLKPIPTTYCTMNADDFCSYGERREDAN